jgi:hypothetical protein
MADHSDNPLTRWGRINLELYYRGFHTEQIICNFEFHESVQRRYYGLLRPVLRIVRTMRTAASAQEIGFARRVAFEHFARDELRLC